MTRAPDTPVPASQDSMVVAATRDKRRAESLCAALHSAGIACTLDGYQQSHPGVPGTTNPALKIRIKVAPGDRQRAARVLARQPGAATASGVNRVGLPAIQRSRDPAWTVLVLLAVVQIGLLALSASRPAWDPSGVDRLIQLGALSGIPAPVEWQRLFTYSFLHRDWTHLLASLAGLVAFGWAGVRLFGLGQAALVYTLAVPVGGLGAALFANPEAVTVGSTGCVFALAAFSLAGLVRQGRAAPVEPWRAWFRAAGWTLFLVPPAFFFAFPEHLGTAAVGLLLGATLPLAPLEATRGFRRRGRALGGISAVLLILPWMWHLVTGSGH